MRTCTNGHINNNLRNICMSPVSNVSSKGDSLKSNCLETEFACSCKSGISTFKKRMNLEICRRIRDTSKCGMTDHFTDTWKGVHVKHHRDCSSNHMRIKPYSENGNKSIIFNTSQFLEIKSSFVFSIKCWKFKLLLKWRCNVVIKQKSSRT